LGGRHAGCDIDLHPTEKRFAFLPKFWIDFLAKTALRVEENQTRLGKGPMQAAEAAHHQCELALVKDCSL